MMKKQLFLVGLILCICLAACNNQNPEDSNDLDLLGLDTTTYVSPKAQEPLDIDSSLLVQEDTTKVTEKVEKPLLTPPKIEFEAMVYKYDTLEEGAVITHEFKFKNIGGKPLQIKDVQGSCGCTIGSYPFLLIASGESGVIKARFDSKGKPGKQESSLTVFSNAEPAQYELKLKGFVKAKQ